MTTPAPAAIRAACTTATGALHLNRRLCPVCARRLQIVHGAWQRCPTHGGFGVMARDLLALAERAAVWQGEREP